MTTKHSQKILMMQIRGKGVKLYQTGAHEFTVLVNFAPSAYPDFIKKLEAGCKVVCITNFDVDMGLINIISHSPIDSIVQDALATIAEMEPKSIVHRGTANP